MTETNGINPIVALLIKNGTMEIDNSGIEMTFELSEEIHKALTAKKVKAQYHFNEAGKLVITKCLGRNINGFFYNEKNKNIERRKKTIKEIIVTVLLDRYNSLITK